MNYSSFNISRSVFYEQAERFFAEGLLKEIYSSDKISICNVANAFYLVFNYGITESGPFGIGLEPKFIKPLITDNSLFYALCESMEPEKLKKSIVFLNKVSFEYLKKVKEKTDSRGSLIDLEFEKNIIESEKSKKG